MSYLLVLLIILIIVTLVCCVVALWNNPPPVEMTPSTLESTFIINIDRKPERYDYVVEQLRKSGIIDFKRWPATDGWVDFPDFRGVTPELAERKGLAGCASSHIKLWEHIRDSKLGWTLILEDDAHFHPNFREVFPEYWKEVPADTIMVFLGYTGNETIVASSHTLVVPMNVMCLHAYMINWEGAQYLLEHLLPLNEPIDIVISKWFETHPGSVVFNEHVIVKDIQMSDYKAANGRRCMFNGIVYQNHEELGSTIHGAETVME